MGSTRETGEPAGPAELRLLPQALTPQTFYTGIHYGHASPTAEGGYDGTPNAESAGTPERIAAAEARLGVALPEGLRALYRVQNGGESCNVAVPLLPRPQRFEDILTPFGGYEDLHPTESLATAWDSFLAFATPQDESMAYLFRNGTDRMVVLSQWYRRTLFLDYSRPGPPSVGHVDFDDPAWAERITRWPDFEAFFAELRRFEVL